MASFTFFIIFIPILALILILVNFVFAPHIPYLEKIDPFECGFTSFQMTRLPFNVSFFIYALLFLLFDLEIVLVYPYVVAASTNTIFGLAIILVFLVLLTTGFSFEIGKSALTIESRQILGIFKSFGESFSTGNIGH